MKKVYKFICQKINGDIAHDFVLATKHAVDFMNWFENSNIYEIDYIEHINELDGIEDNKTIPVGTVEFVESFYKRFYGIELMPINIPLELLDYAQRNVWYGDETQEIDRELFCKSNSKVKGFTGIVKKGTILDKGEYLFSDIIDIESEWRCFVYRGQLLGIHNYINSLSHYPDVGVVREMVNKYKKLDAYTLDIGVNDKGTFIIEIHDFYSCGLYGFRDYQKILYMTIASHNQKIRRRD